MKTNKPNNNNSKAAYNQFASEFDGEVLVEFNPLNTAEGLLSDDEFDL